MILNKPTVITLYGSKIVTRESKYCSFGHGEGNPICVMWTGKALRRPTQERRRSKIQNRQLPHHPTHRRPRSLIAPYEYDDQGAGGASFITTSMLIAHLHRCSVRPLPFQLHKSHPNSTYTGSTHCSVNDDKLRMHGRGRPNKGSF